MSTTMEDLINSFIISVMVQVEITMLGSLMEAIAILIDGGERLSSISGTRFVIICVFLR